MTYRAIHKAAGSLATSHSQKAADWNHPPEGVPVSSSHSRLMGHFSVQQWNVGIVPVEVMEWLGTVRPAAL